MARSSGRRRFLFWNQSGPSGSGDVSVEEDCTVEEPVPESPAKPPIATKSELETVPPGRALVRSPSRNSLPPEPQPHILDQVGAYSYPRIAPPSFSVLPTLVFPSIPREPYVTLSSLGTERFQLSDVTVGELDMKLYAFRCR